MTMMMKYVREVAPQLDATDRLVLNELCEHYGRGPSHMASALNMSESQGRTRLRRLQRQGLCEYGPLFDEEDCRIHGRGYWISPFGRAVKDALEAPPRVPRGEMADMVEGVANVIRGAGLQDDTPTRAHVVLPPIGLSGFAGVGKTAAAQIIQEEMHYQRQHIAEPLRRMLASLLREYGYDDELIQRWLTGDWKDDVLIPELGVTSRHLQITLGTEWGREQVHPDIWAKLWSVQAEVGRAVDGRGRLNDSVRFPNEENAIRRIGGITILVTRPGVGPGTYKWKRLGPLLYRWFGCFWGVHDSERLDRLRPDYVVVNDSSLEILRGKIAAIAEQFHLSVDAIDARL